VRNRTHGGVRGRGIIQISLLLDYTYLVLTFLPKNKISGFEKPEICGKIKYEQKPNLTEKLYLKSEWISTKITTRIRNNYSRE
ncbi:hypothetical protein, partial [Eubacterium xylanophilum]|uniref:hypothetical protein n=1 Tax=Eubacterium xylanophilum TaxID=39497 RepID=UPI000479E867